MKPAMGIDAGGLRRQFVTTLLENLFKEQSGFHFTEELGGKLPLLDDLNHGDQVIALRVLARLIALCATSSLLMGEHLPLNFFYAIKALSDQEIDSISFDKALEEGLSNKIYYSLIGEKFENEMQVGAAVPADVVPMDLDESIGMEIDQEEIVKYPVMRPIAIVAKELKSIQGFSLDLLRNNTETFINRVKGKVVTKEDLLNSMLIENFTIRRYFEKYLEENPDRCVKILELFTSCRTIGENPIYIHVFPNRDTGRLPSIHTCSQEVEMPLYSSYEQFKDKIEGAFQALGTFENA